MREHPRIAIDGPAGVGKSTIGERVARRLGYHYIDTGAFYRALALAALERGVDPLDVPALTALAERMALAIVPPTVADGRQYTVRIDGVDVTASLRTPAVEAAVSQVARPQPVRAALIARMRAMADDQRVVMVGRDIGTVVLPDADLKIYLTTSLDERARRRHADLVALHGAASPSLEAVYAAIAQRDETDRAQMRPAADSLVINNDHLEPAETVNRILSILAQRFPGRRAAVGESPRER